MPPDQENFPFCISFHFKKYHMALILNEYIIITHYLSAFIPELMEIKLRNYHYILPTVYWHASNVFSDFIFFDRSPKLSILLKLTILRL
jgi:hypothetical protein